MVFVLRYRMGLNADERFVERNGRLPASNSKLYGSLCVTKVLRGVLCCLKHHTSTPAAGDARPAYEERFEDEVDRFRIALPRDQIR